MVPREPPSSASRPRRADALLLVAVLTAGIACSGAAAPGRPASSRPADPRRRLVLVGLDAADWAVLDPLAAAGRLPAFARLKAHGRTGVMLATPPLISPILWTTIATGRPPE